MATAIKFENICKQYRIGLVSTGTLSHDLYYGLTEEDREDLCENVFEFFGV